MYRCLWNKNNNKQFSFSCSHHVINTKSYTLSKSLGNLRNPNQLCLSLLTPFTFVKHGLRIVSTEISSIPQLLLSSYFIFFFKISVLNSYVDQLILPPYRLVNI